MKMTRLNLRICDQRFNKLYQYVASKEQGVTQIVKGAILQLLNTKIDKNPTTPHPSNQRFDGDYEYISQIYASKC
jgi:hypothetical protein